MIKTDYIDGCLFVNDKLVSDGNNLMWWGPVPKARSTEVHNREHASDTLVPGTFVPNMSKEWKLRWKGKITGQKRGKPQVELRRDGVVIIVGDRGIKYKWYETDQFTVHIASSGPFQMDAAGYITFTGVIKRATEALISIQEIEEGIDETG